MPIASAKAAANPEVSIFLPAGVSNVSAISSLESALGGKFYSCKWYQDWTGAFESGIASSFKTHGALPELTWQPQTSAGGINYDDVLNGKYNSYIDSFAGNVKSFGSPIRISLAPEMNGDWATWGITKNSPAKQQAFWQYVVNRFRADGVSNVNWVWSPNIRYGDNYSYASLYPGDSYVDYVGLDGYNWGTTQSWGSTWQSFAQVFAPSYNELTKLTSKKILIMETASAEAGGNKAAWITDMFAQIHNNYPQIQGFTWFSENKETDWRIDSSTASRDAFAAGMKGAASSSAASTSSSSSTPTSSSSKSSSSAPATSSSSSSSSTQNGSSSSSSSGTSSGGQQQASSSSNSSSSSGVQSSAPKRKHWWDKLFRLPNNFKNAWLMTVAFMIK